MKLYHTLSIFMHGVEKVRLVLDGSANEDIQIMQIGRVPVLALMFFLLQTTCY